jgi:hypothetical protein
MVLTPLDWVKTIDLESRKALENKWSRFDINWGMWSSVMNRYIQEQVKSGSPDSDKFKFVFAYWVSMSQCIEMAHKKSLGFPINETKFVEEVSHLEKMKEAIKQDKWSLV